MSCGCALLEIGPDTIRREAGEIKVCKGNREIKCYEVRQRKQNSMGGHVEKPLEEALLWSPPGVGRSVEELDTDQG